MSPDGGGISKSRRRKVNAQSNVESAVIGNTAYNTERHIFTVENNRQRHPRRQSRLTTRSLIADCSYETVSFETGSANRRLTGSWSAMSNSVSHGREESSECSSAEMSSSASSTTQGNRRLRRRNGVRQRIQSLDADGSSTPARSLSSPFGKRVKLRNNSPFDQSVVKSQSGRSTFKSKKRRMISEEAVERAAIERAAIYPSDYTPQGHAYPSLKRSETPLSNPPHRSFVISRLINLTERVQHFLQTVKLWILFPFRMARKISIMITDFVRTAAWVIPCLILCAAVIAVCFGLSVFGYLLLHWFIMPKHSVITVPVYFNSAPTMPIQSYAPVHALLPQSNDDELILPFFRAHERIWANRNEKKRRNAISLASLNSLGFHAMETSVKSLIFPFLRLVGRIVVIMAHGGYSGEAHDDLQNLEKEVSPECPTGLVTSEEILNTPVVSSNDVCTTNATQHLQSVVPTSAENITSEIVLKSSEEQSNKSAAYSVSNTNNKGQQQEYHPLPTRNHQEAVAIVELTRDWLFSGGCSFLPKRNEPRQRDHLSVLQSLKPRNRLREERSTFRQSLALFDGEDVDVALEINHPLLNRRDYSPGGTIVTPSARQIHYHIHNYQKPLSDSEQISDTELVAQLPLEVPAAYYESSYLTTMFSIDIFSGDCIRIAHSTRPYITRLSSNFRYWAAATLRHVPFSSIILPAAFQPEVHALLPLYDDLRILRSHPLGALQIRMGSGMPILNASLRISLRLRGLAAIFRAHPWASAFVFIWMSTCCSSSFIIWGVIRKVTAENEDLQDDDLATADSTGASLVERSVEGACVRPRRKFDFPVAPRNQKRQTYPAFDRNRHSDRKLKISPDRLIS